MAAAVISVVSLGLAVLVALSYLWKRMNKDMGKAANEYLNSHPQQIEVEQQLNSCPFNIEAEQLAMEDCMRGLMPKPKQWSEKDMVVHCGGKMLPGTPDGMFEEPADENSLGLGCVTAVQVVRCPITSAMSFAEMEEVFYQTVLMKLYKSQIWMSSPQIRRWLISTNRMIYEFVIFVWLPFPTPQICGERTQALIDQLRLKGWPFSLRVKIPPEPSTVFPPMFAWQRLGRGGGLEGRQKKSVSEADLSTTFNVSDDLSDDEEDPWPQYDIFADVDEED